MDNRLKYSNETGKTPTYLISVGFLASQPMSTKDYTEWLEYHITKLESDNAELVFCINNEIRHYETELKDCLKRIDQLTDDNIIQRYTKERALRFSYESILRRLKLINKHKPSKDNT